MKVTLSVEQNETNTNTNALRVTVYEASSYGNEEAVETVHVTEETSFEFGPKHSFYVKPYTIA